MKFLLGKGFFSFLFILAMFFPFGECSILPSFFLFFFFYFKQIANIYCLRHKSLAICSQEPFFVFCQINLDFFFLQYLLWIFLPFQMNNESKTCFYLLVFIHCSMCPHSQRRFTDPRNFKGLRYSRFSVQNLHCNYDKPKKKSQKKYE